MTIVATTIPIGLPRVTAGFGTTAAEHRESLGPLPDVDGATLVSLVATAGLRGRGGAGFPTATKMDAVARGRSPVVVANATEGEPLSRKDAWLLTRSPHLVLDGIEVAARAVGARRAFLVVSAPDAARTVREALADRSASPVGIRLVRSDAGFLGGEESALVALVNGRPPVPADRLVRVWERGVGGRPTLVNNVETLANLALLARFGPAWFRTVGTAEEPGSMLCSVIGAVRSPGVHEVALGTPLADLLEAAGAGRFQAVLVGGYHGGWLTRDEAASVRLSRASLAPYGLSPGAGVVVVLGEDRCGLRYAAEVTAYLAGQSARQCGPCLNGLPAMATRLSRLADGRAAVADVDRLVPLVHGRGACAHPDGTARFVASSLRVFADDVEAHRRGGCRAAPAR